MPEHGQADKNAFKRKSEKIRKKLEDVVHIMKLTKEQMKGYLQSIN